MQTACRPHLRALHLDKALVSYVWPVGDVQQQPEACQQSQQVERPVQPPRLAGGSAAGGGRARGY